MKRSILKFVLRNKKNANEKMKETSYFVQYKYEWTKNSALYLRSFCQLGFGTEKVVGTVLQKHPEVGFSHHNHKWGMTTLVLVVAGKNVQNTYT